MPFAFAVASTVLLARVWAIYGIDPSSTPARLAAVGALGIIAVWAVLRPRRRRYDPSMMLLYVGVVALLLIAYFRAAWIGVNESPEHAAIEGLILALVAVIAIYGVTMAPQRDARLVLLGVCWAPIVYVGFNVALYVTGLVPERLQDSATPAVMLGYFGVDVSRVFFPLALGINNFGVVAGAALLSGVMLTLKTPGWVRVVPAAGAAVSGLGLLLADSRGAAFFVGVTLAFLILLPRRMRRSLSSLPILLPFAPTVLLIFLAQISATNLGAAIGREGADLATASERSSVWGTVLELLSHPSLLHVFGFGAWGQVESGASLDYARYLEVVGGRPDLAAAHNFMLQYILDVGYLGLALILALLFFALRALLRASAATRKVDPLVLTIAGILVYFTLAGIAEAAPSIYYNDALIVWLLVLAVAMRTDLATLLEQRTPRVGESAQPPPLREPPRERSLVRD